MILHGAGGQTGPHSLYWADGTIASGANPQLVLAASQSRSMLLFQNLSSAPMYVNIGVAHATTTLTSGVVTGVTVTNGGFGFTYPPSVCFLGGGSSNVSGNLATAQPGGSTPQNPAQGLAVLAAGAVSSVTITNGGANYLTAPYVLFINDPRDSIGCVKASSTLGMYVPALGGQLFFNGTACPTDPVSVFCPTAGSAYACRWMV